MDYRALLVKYMAGVMVSEGVSLADSLRISDSDTQEKIDEMHQELASIEVEARQLCDALFSK